MNAPPKHNPRLHDLVWKLRSKHSPGKLLDIPSGPGYFAQQAAAAGFESVAAEIDESLHVFEEVTYRKVDMASVMPFDDESFDYIVSIEGIEHIENQFLFLRECFRVLREEGRLFLTTPNASSLENRLSFFWTGFHDNPPRPIRDDSASPFMEHINLMPFHRLEAFLRFAGFNIETVTSAHMRRGSTLLYPLVYPIAYLRYRSTFRKHFKGGPEEQHYREIFKLYLSRAVMCGGHNVVVAVKG